MPNPTLVVTFYMQLQETQGLLAVIENEIPPNEVLVGGHIRVLADLLINQCQLARSILSSPEASSEKGEALLAGQSSSLCKILDEHLAAAKKEFPDAELFHGNRPIIPIDEAKAQAKAAASATRVNG